MKKILKNTKGITLVALVITIIILLILAGISISALTNTGLFEKAKEARDKTYNATENQAKTLNEYEDELNKYVSGTTSTQKLADKVKVGDYVTYTPDELDNNALTTLKTNLKNYSGASDNTTNSAIARDSLSWRVLDIDEKTGQVRLISATPTSSTIALKGYNGYNNAVKLLDDACSTLYNSKLATKVQNLKIEDITKHMTTQPTEETEYHPKYIDYPKILEQEKNQTVVKSTTENKLEVSSQSIFVTGYDTSATSTLKNNYWYKTMTTNDFDGENKEMYYKLFIKNGEKNYNEYWISSRCVDADSDVAYFRVRFVYSGLVNANVLYNSRGTEFPDAFAFCPVITLNSNVQVTSGDGTESTPFEIK